MKQTTYQFLRPKYISDITFEPHEEDINVEALRAQCKRITDRVIATKSKGGILTEASKEHTDWQVRLAAFIEFGFDDTAKYDDNPIIRYNAVKATGDAETPIKTDPCIVIKYCAHEIRGWQEQDKHEHSTLISTAAYKNLGWTPDAKDHDSIDVRKQYYIQTNQMELAKQDGERRVRQWAYEELGWDEAAKQDEHRGTRHLAYEKLGYDEIAKQDECWMIREAAYENLGFDEEAKDDEDEDIRREAYEALGWTEKALSDECNTIQYIAHKELGYIQEDMKDLDNTIRDGAIDYFIEANLLLESPDGILKTKFTEDEACILEMNQIPVREKARLK